MATKSHIGHNVTHVQNQICDTCSKSHIGHNVTHVILWLSAAHHMHISFVLNRFSVRYRFPFPILGFFLPWNHLALLKKNAWSLFNFEGANYELLTIMNIFLFKTLLKWCFCFANNVTSLTAHIWQSWKSRFLTCPCYEIYIVKTVGLYIFNFCWYVDVGVI